MPTTTILTYELSGVKFDSHIVNELLAHFQQYYSDHVPFIDIEKSATSIYQASDVLFWALLLISARNHPLFNRQFPQLQSAFHRLLSEYVVRTIDCTYTIQALLLLCTWPMPVARQCDDPSWNYCNLAVSAVQQIGIHEPIHTEGKRSAQSIGYLKSWIGCFVISTELATDYGFPPPMSLVTGRLPIVKSYTQSHFSDEFWARCELQQHSIRVFTTLYDNSSTKQLQMSLVGLLERDLDSLGANIKTRVSQRYHIDFLAAKLRLCSIPSLTLISKEVETSNTQEWAAWYRGFHVAIQLTTIYTSLRSCYPQRPAEELLSHELQVHGAETVHYPKHFFRVLCISGMYLAKFLAVGCDTQPQERTLARNKIKEVYENFLAWSKEELDEPFRTARMIGLLSRHAEDKISSEYFSNDSGDPSATIVDDSLRIAKKIRERTAATQADTDKPEGQPRLPRPDAISSEWSDWLPNTYDDLFAFLASPSNNYFDEPWI
ncbi:uncharacterized protein TrAFT101_002345 [Trichoderma asperellum]|nr:hypothetical protein TrAFT101_002345 [Trichoderma asperellum]